MFRKSFVKDLLVCTIRLADSAFDLVPVNRPAMDLFRYRNKNLSRETHRDHGFHECDTKWMDIKRMAFPEKFCDQNFLAQPFILCESRIHVIFSSTRSAGIVQWPWSWMVPFLKVPRNPMSDRLPSQPLPYSVQKLRSQWYSV